MQIEAGPALAAVGNQLWAAWVAEDSNGDDNQIFVDQVSFDSDGKPELIKTPTELFNDVAQVNESTKQRRRWQASTASCLSASPATVMG